MFTRFGKQDLHEWNKCLILHKDCPLNAVYNFFHWICVCILFLLIWVICAAIIRQVFTSFCFSGFFHSKACDFSGALGIFFQCTYMSEHVSALSIMLVRTRNINTAETHKGCIDIQTPLFHPQAIERFCYAEDCKRGYNFKALV